MNRQAALSLIMPLLLTLLLAYGFAPAHAQTVRGRLLESGANRPIALGSVALIDSAGRIVDQTVTNEAGLFELKSPVPGAFYVAAEKLGYRRVTDGVLELRGGREVTIEFLMLPEPLKLDSLRAQARRTQRDRFLNNQGFYQRHRSGFGYFITPEQIEKRQPMSLPQLFQPLGLQVRVAREDFFGTVLKVKGPRGLCDPALYVDGVRIGTEPPGNAGAPFVLEEVVAADDIAAVEVYNRGSNVPLQYGGVMMGGCGVVLIWTKH